MADRKSEDTHSAMIRVVVDCLENDLYTDLRADVPGYIQPLPIILKNHPDAHIPDVTGVKKDEFHLFEVETEDTINDVHTESEWRLFADFAEKYHNVFHIVVPKGLTADTEKQLLKLNIRAVVHGIREMESIEP